MEKRARTKRYRIISNVTGSWLPLWSQGFCVCIHPPLTDEPRIALSDGDLVNVTRWRKYWLFGEKIQDISETIQQPQQNGKKNKSNGSKVNVDAMPKRVRGWFPRKAAVEFFEDDSDSESESEVSESKKIK
jgi:palmitoyltransferase